MHASERDAWIAQLLVCLVNLPLWSAAFETTQNPVCGFIAAACMAGVVRAANVLWRAWKRRNVYEVAA